MNSRQKALGFPPIPLPDSNSRVYDRARMTTAPMNLSLALPSVEASTIRRMLAVVFAFFVVAGVATVMLGPALPLLAARWGLPDSRSGTLFVAFFAGQFGGSWMATPRVRTSLLVGSAATAAGLVALAVVGAAMAHLALFCVGLGLGAGLTAGNVIVGTIHSTAVTRVGEEASGKGTARSRMLALLNVSWGLGAIACPLLLNASLHTHRFGAQRGELFFVSLAAGFAVCTVLIACFLPGELSAGKDIAKPSTRLPWRVVVLFGATLVLYVGVENSLGGWLPTYAERLAASGSFTGRAASIALCFWSCELASRGLMALYIRWVNEGILYRGCLGVLIAVTGLLFLTPHLSVAATFAITALAAISLAPVFPLAISFLLARTGNHPEVGKIFAGAALGGTLLPWFTGLLSTHFANLRLGFVVPAVGAFLILVLSRFLPVGEVSRTA
jgi:FHS family glucose/mannose:H+ symporter-like MFS transporter